MKKKGDKQMTYEILRDVTSANELLDKDMNKEVLEENLRHYKTICRNIYAPLFSGLVDLMLCENGCDSEVEDTLSTLLEKALDAGDEEQTIWVHNLKKIIEKYSK
jgi:uncharacterized protein YdiU (UPF0061 family)